MRHYINSMKAVLMTGLFLFSAQAQQVLLTGTVKDASTQAGIAGAVVMLAGQPYITVTNADGAYTLTSNSVRFQKTGSTTLAAAPRFDHNAILFCVAGNNEKVRIDLIALSGRHVATLLNENLAPGNYRIEPSFPALGNQLCFAAVRTGRTTAMLKIPMVDRRSNGSISGTSGKEASARSMEKALVTDTLIIAAAGYKPVLKAISSYSGANDFSLSHQSTIGMLTVDNYYYQSFAAPMSITVNDSDCGVPAIPVKVKSSTDTTGFTVWLKHVPGYNGMYNDSLKFTLSKSDSAKKVLKVSDGDTLFVQYTDASPAGTKVDTAYWNGVAGTVGPSQSIYQGLVSKMRVDLSDADLLDSTAVVHVKSDRDAAGIDVTLKVDGSTPGTYHGMVGFTLGASSAMNAMISVDPAGDNLMITYADQSPVGTRSGTLMWWAVAATINFDSTVYHGTVSKMKTILNEDILGSTATVKIKSKKDTVGINATLNADSDYGGNAYSALIGFSTTASGPGVIRVNSTGDTISVSFKDDSPDSTMTEKIPWLP